MDWIAVHWNPTNAKIAFEHAETSKMLGDMDTFYKLTKNIFRISFRPDDLAHCYRNLGFYFVEKELWREAMGCYLLSLQYDRESKNAMSELYYIHDKTGNKIKEPTLVELKALAEQHGFPMGADKDILGLSYAYGKHFAEQKDFAAARYFWQITYGLTDMHHPYHDRSR